MSTDRSAWDLPEIAAYQSGRGIIRIPCEQDVPFTSRVRALVDTPEFQRLQHISQLGLVVRVYPGATHTRFEHALGVYHNAVRYLAHLSRNERFTSLCTQKDAELLLVAALLHDLGHWPFCHPIEDMALESILDHEEFAYQFLMGETELNRVLKSEWQIDPADVLDILVPRRKSSTRSLLRSILSGPIDIDKMDYLDRDSLHAGVPYGRNFDRNRLITSLTVNEAGDGLAITSKGKTAAELMVFARYVMFSEVYWHHAVRSATSMFARSFYELRDRLDLQAFFRQRESESIADMREAARGTNCESLVEGLLGSKRALYKRVVEYSAVDDPEIYERLAHRPFEELIPITQKLQQILQQEFRVSTNPHQILIDAPPPKREVQFKIDVLYTKDQKFRSLTSVSPVVEALAHRQFDDYVKKVRLFVAPELVDQLNEEIIEQAISRLSF
ncbi:HD domain-containing protein [Rubinisphaera sp.]|uniref:HD domain-containing protein n=1 Tax=Rubinisphaera sp. TaxID=2024857 RepID=UPI000C0D0DCA|nr:HD domain-containing protein [Rubinisphaera sp.]MBV11416.1 metal-dependent phosphohydrolase [Rubinisphaera sp.]HCS51672.1 metal-dependent phosphohydrolase [Planctomycetaceae bacterium]|tara:strand:- start:1474 stop:2805 length:1332 start_codon:yes stop_codon:yes gene_type:complete